MKREVENRDPAEDCIAIRMPRVACVALLGLVGLVKLRSLMSEPALASILNHPKQG